MTTISEVVVKAIPEGMSDVRSGLQGMNEDVEETTDSMDEQASALGDVSQRFQGAMAAVTAGFAVAAGGLLSQVPVLGETMGAFGTVVDSLSMKMDGVLRPVFTKVNDALFGLSEKINDADGVMGTIIGTIATVASVLAVVGSAVLAVATQVFGFSAVWGFVASVVKVAIGGIISIIGGIPAAIAAVILALGAFVVAYLTNWKGMRDKTDSVIGTIVDFVVDGFKWLAENGLEFISKLVDRAIGFFNSLGGGLSDWADNIASDAVGWGKGIINGLISGMKSLLTEGGGKIAEMLGLDDISTDDITSEFDFEGIDTSSFDDLSSDLDIDKGEFDSGVSESDDFIGSVGSSESKIFLDGSRVDDNQGRFRKDALNRRS